MTSPSSRIWPVLLAFMVLLTACDRKEEAPAEKAKAPVSMTPPLPMVVITQTEQRAIQPGFEYPATIEAVESAAMRPQVAGVVKSRHITPGSSVKKGDLLMEIDDADYRMKIDEIRANMTQTQANAAEAEANFERAKRLKDKGYISLKDFDSAKARNLGAGAMIAQMQAKLRRAQLDLERTRIYAPFSGRISAAYYAVGDYVAPSSPKPLFELAKIDPIYAVGNVNMTIYEEFVFRRAERKAQGKEMVPVELGIKLSSGREYNHKGTFENWDNSASGSTGTIAGRALFPNPDGLLLPGHKVTLIGRTMTPIDSVVVPQKAVSQDQQGHYVMIVDENDVVRRQNIDVGIRDGEDWAVSSGLETRERVIVEGLQKVRPGMKVQVGEM